MGHSRADKEFFNSLFPEEGPGLCSRPGCARTRVKLSDLCARHYFEAAKRKPCPWDEPVRLSGPSVGRGISGALLVLTVLLCLSYVACAVASVFVSPEALGWFSAGFALVAVAWVAFAVGRRREKMEYEAGGQYRGPSAAAASALSVLWVLACLALLAGLVCIGVGLARLASR